MKKICILISIFILLISALPGFAQTNSQNIKNEVSKSTPFPRTFSHIGISVPDLDAAVKFYTEVLGWYLIMEPTDVVEDDSAIGKMCTDVFGSGWKSFRIAHLSTGDRIGVELFEFRNQENPENNFEYWKTGVFHFAVQDPNSYASHQVRTGPVSTCTKFDFG